MMQRRRTPLLHRLRWFVWSKARGYPPVDELVYRGLVVGPGVTITRNVFLDPAHCHLIEIGEGATLAPDVIVLAHDASTKAHIGYSRIARVRIGARAFIGARSIVLPGVTIGDDAIVGAGSVVSRDIAPGMVAVGSPAREVMSTEDYVARHREQLHVLPTYPREQWTHRVGMAPGNAQRMADDLESTDGYVQ
jgi:maltose O-acetyltransferase